MIVIIVLMWRMVFLTVADKFYGIYYYCCNFAIHYGSLDPKINIIFSKSLKFLHLESHNSVKKYPHFKTWVSLPVLYHSAGHVLPFAEYIEGFSVSKEERQVSCWISNFIFLKFFNRLLNSCGLLRLLQNLLAALELTWVLRRCLYHTKWIFIICRLPILLCCYFPSYWKRSHKTRSFSKVVQSIKNIMSNGAGCVSTSVSSHVCHVGVVDDCPKVVIILMSVIKLGRRDTHEDNTFQATIHV
jgi:hypothetical protein